MFSFGDISDKCIIGLIFKVAASLLYADSGTPVEKMMDSEAPLLVSYEGVEFSAEDKLCSLLNGCASFNFKITQVVMIVKSWPL